MNFVTTGSLEEVVENLVKTWEMEASHKKNISQWTTIEHGTYCVQTNGGEVVDGVKAFEIGNYNALFKGCPAYEKCKYNAKVPNFLTSVIRIDW
jgi:hypothetical protein